MAGTPETHNRDANRSSHTGAGPTRHPEHSGGFNTLGRSAVIPELPMCRVVFGRAAELSTVPVFIFCGSL
jgi:hypothetical protein